MALVATWSGRSPRSNWSRSMTTDVSSRPWTGRSGSATWGGVGIGEGVEVGAEPLVVHRRCGAEHLHGRLRQDETATPQRLQLAHWDPIAGHDEGLAALEQPHDLAAVVAELPLGHLSGHVD